MESSFIPLSSTLKTFTPFSSKCNNSDARKEDVIILSTTDVLTSTEITYKNTDQRCDEGSRPTGVLQLDNTLK
jgi:hypothetical protein